MQADDLEHPLGLGPSLLRAARSGRCSLRPRITPCDTRYAGLSALNGSWKTIGTSLRYARLSRRERMR